jgi:hypothetical protein
VELNLGTNAPSKSNSVPTESAVTAETSIRVGESRVSPNGVYKLFVEDNGNVAITKNGDKIWETNTANRGVSYFKVQQDGNLVAYTSSDRAVWASNTHGKGNNSAYLQCKMMVIWCFIKMETTLFGLQIQDTCTRKLKLPTLES